MDGCRTLADPPFEICKAYNMSHTVIFEVREMKKKTRNTLTDLLQEVDINNLKEPEIEPKKS